MKKQKNFVNRIMTILKNERLHKAALFTAVAILFINVLPAAAHGGDEEEALAAVALGSNVILLSVSIFFSLVVYGIVFRLTSMLLNFWGVVIILLSAFAAFVHLGLGMRGDLLLLLNGLGFLALMALYAWSSPFFESKRQLLRWILIGYTAVTFIGYFATHPLGAYSKLGLLTKASELALLTALSVQVWQARKKGTQSVTSAQNPV